MKIYVAAPYSKSEQVRLLHDRLSAMGHLPTSRWAEKATSPVDDLLLMTLAERRMQIDENDEDIVRSHLVVALVVAGLGKEMFAEAALARLLHKPVLWVGAEETMPLSAFRPGSMVLSDLTHLFDVLSVPALLGPSDKALEALYTNFRMD